MYLSEILVSIPLETYPEDRLLDYIVPFLIFWGTSLMFSIVAAWYTFSSIVHRGSLFPYPHQYLLTLVFLKRAISTSVGDISFWLRSMSMIINDVEHLSCICWPFLHRLWKNVYSVPLLIFWLDCLFFFAIRRYEYMFWTLTNPLSDMQFANIFFPFPRLPFDSVVVFLCWEEVFYSM